MATLILTTVGTAVGGPVGGALGSLVGQAIDSNVFGHGAKRGPRLDDLKVQTSSYGTQIPRIYGRMRVAGTVVWATDLKESEAAEGGGKGSPETLQYHYSCSFAVALSSRPIHDVGRIWADGKLIRGAAGDLKVRGELRVHRGTEDQPGDPLIATVEGPGATPAYRGTALAVFEDLDLAEFGNRVPVLTFEVIADEAEVSVGSIAGDLCNTASVDGGEGPDLVGFAALGSDCRSAVEGLAALCDVRIIEGPENVIIVGDEGPTFGVDLADAGWNADRKPEPAKGEWTRDPATSVPESLTIGYHEPARDFQAGAMRASGGGGRGDAVIDSAAAMSAQTAKSWALRALARRWAGRDRMTIALSTDWIGLAPGHRLQFAWRSGSWTVEEVLIEAFAVKVTCRRAAAAATATAMSADAGRSVCEADVAIGRSILGLFEIPALGAEDDTACLHVAVSSAGGFKRVALSSEIGGADGPEGVAWRKARLGAAEGVLESAPAEVVDRRNTIVVTLIEPGQSLFHADDKALDAGANLAMIGNELVQFGRAEPLGAGRYRLSHLLRGRRGSEWAIVDHAPDEPFVMVDMAALVPLSFASGRIGLTADISAVGVADDESSPPTARKLLRGTALAPLAPCHPVVIGTSTRRITWVARSRMRWDWNGGSDAVAGPVAYDVDIAGTQGTIRRTVTVEAVDLSATDLAALGAGRVDVGIRALGARRASETLSVNFTI